MSWVLGVHLMLLMNSAFHTRLNACKLIIFLNWIYNF